MLAGCGFAGQLRSQHPQELPFRAGVTRGLNGLMKALDAAFGVDERASFLGVCATGQEVMGALGGGVGEDIGHDESFELVEEVG
jgi:hypothetical protein